MCNASFSLFQACVLKRQNYGRIQTDCAHLVGWWLHREKAAHTCRIFLKNCSYQVGQENPSNVQWPLVFIFLPTMGNWRFSWTKWANFICLLAISDFAFRSVSDQVLWEWIANSSHVKGSYMSVMFVVPIRWPTPLKVTKENSNE